MRNDDYKVELTSYDEILCHVKTRVKIESENYTTFKEIVEAVTPILEKEDIKSPEKK